MNVPREITNVLNTGLNVYNGVVCIVMMIALSKDIRRSRASLYFFLACASVLVFNIADLSTWTVEGLAHSWYAPALKITTFIYYFIVPFMYLFLIKYIQEYLRPNRIKNWYFSVSFVFSCFYIVGVLISPMTGFYYRISSENIYFRGEYNAVCYIFYVLYYLMVLLMVLQNIRLFPKKSVPAFFAYALFPILGVLIQMKFYGIATANIGMTLSILLIYINAHRELQHAVKQSEDEIRRKERRLLEMQEKTIVRLASVIDGRECSKGEKPHRAAAFIECLANKVREDGLFPETLSSEYIQKMISAAPLYDIGKIAVSDSILRKKGRLTPDEYTAMQIHCVEGSRLVPELFGFSDDRRFIKISQEMAKFHHERWDGKGYPDRLKGNDIPLCARFMSIIDVFDALVFDRCYKERFDLEKAFEIIEAAQGVQFDSVLVKAFLNIRPEITRLVELYNK